MGRKTKHYCCFCSNFRGKVVDGHTISLHRFPADVDIRRVWIQRVKLVMKKFEYNEHVRLCSAHFVGGKGPSKEINIPSIFKTKIFQTSTASSSSLPNDDIELPTPTFGEENESESSFDSSGTGEGFKTGESAVNTSLLFHDYFGPVDPLELPTKVDKNEMTVKPLFKTIGTQTDVCVQTRTTSVETQTDTIQKTTSDFACQVQRPMLTFEDIKSSDEQLMFYTGIPNAGTFQVIFDELKDYQENTFRQKSSTVENSEGGRPRILRPIDEFLLVLMRLRLGLLIEDLAYRFCISKSTCSSIVDVWIDYLSEKLDFLVSWPSKDVVNETMPEQFKDKHSDCRVIIDCTEIKTETPQSLANKSLMYSNYKSHMTWKCLLGISPSGVITYTSDLWAGSISDKQLTNECGILDLCEKGDAIVADKGFLISDLTTPRGVKLVIPPLKSRDRQFTRREVEETRRIANLRIHVERAIERVKNFRILQGVMPISISRKASKTWKLCCGFSNLQPPLINSPNED